MTFQFIISPIFGDSRIAYSPGGKYSARDDKTGFGAIVRTLTCFTYLRTRVIEFGEVDFISQMRFSQGTPFTCTLFSKMVEQNFLCAGLNFVWS